MLFKWVKLPSGCVVPGSCVLNETFGWCFVNYSPLLLPDPAPEGQGCKAMDSRWGPACLHEVALMFPVYSDHAAFQAVNHHGAMWHAQHRCMQAFFRSLSPLGLSFSLGLILLILHLLLMGPLIVSASLMLSTGRRVSLPAVCWTARASSSSDEWWLS